MFEMLSHLSLNSFKENECTSRGGSSVKMVLPLLGKEIYSKWKEFAPSGSKFFPFRVDPFSEGAWCAGK